MSGHERTSSAGSEACGAEAVQTQEEADGTTVRRGLSPRLKICLNLIRQKLQSLLSFTGTKTPLQCQLCTSRGQANRVKSFHSHTTSGDQKSLHQLLISNSC
ncbi:hypothetical protein WMY93_025678 [Mugilogobius chulae]|uniref:Uncharacterized protein n=1 Tax=Mugilogobius chulae TaxID=88201 RepID=A0AAW0N214_9GOBI